MNHEDIKRITRPASVKSFKDNPDYLSDISGNLIVISGKLIDYADKLENSTIDNISKDSSAFLWGDDEIDPHVSDNVLSRMADRSYRDRRVRDSLFEFDNLFGEPAWDIMLDLLRSEKSGLKISVTSACLASAVPPTTALRWLKILEDKGLIYRENDEIDGRRAFVRLSAKAMNLFHQYYYKTRSLRRR